MAFIGNTYTTQGFVPAVDYFNGDGSTTAFTLSRPVGSVFSVQVVVENVPQKPGDAFTVSGNTITFTSAPPSGTQNIYVYYTSPITQVIAPSQGTVDTTALADNAVTTAKIANANVTIAKISATGTPSSSTFLRGDSSWAAAGFPSGTAMLFAQTNAPTGWTKSTTHNDKALRVVSGTAGSGGSVAFSTAFAASLSAGATTLSTAQMPSHTHDLSLVNGCGGITFATRNSGGIVAGTQATSSVGGGGSHTHTLPSFAVQYVDVIIATQN